MLRACIALSFAVRERKIGLSVQMNGVACQKKLYYVVNVACRDWLQGTENALL